MAALPSCLACLISFRLTYSSTSHQQTKWFLLSSSTPASTCPRSASASGRSTAPSLPMSSTTLSRQATASSMVPVVCLRLPASDCTSHNTYCVNTTSPLACSISRGVHFCSMDMRSSDTIADMDTYLHNYPTSTPVTSAHPACRWMRHYPSNSPQNDSTAIKDTIGTMAWFLLTDWKWLAYRLRQRG